MKSVRTPEEFDLYDIQCLAYVFHICEMGLENQFAERGSQAPEYVIEELHDLKKRLTNLLRKKVCQ